ncbi:hypothetical protein [Nocardioides bizhenqiangii]|uniref:SH3 domain-containing protein n=1 Tax=Nocardioides bizhenqiangii TaxID=3095076 RepID=A0ABZ0ZQD5_9ACTN|nr:hypothetical protein [Nocardioides sp. HM61]WQQ26530.1 hypothetical protein SHK19_21570 [Nocardioides sp. HM61]
MTTLLLGFAGSATAGVVVTGKQIKDGTITSRDLRDADLRSADVKDDSLTRRDFDARIIGMSGPSGDIGQPGAPGTAGLTYSIEPFAIPKDTTRTWGAPCPNGTRVLSGGGSADTPGVVQLTESGPVDDAGTGWWVGMRNKTNSTVTGYAWALCVTAS